MKRALGKTLACSLAYLLVAAACMVQWNGADHWPRVDFFAGSYFALRLIGSLHSIASSLGALRSQPLREEWWASNSDVAGSQWVMVLMAFDLLVFLDYGHWHLGPRGLAHSALQIVGVALYLAVTIWQIWTDDCLATYFSRREISPVPMNRGPYRYVRHPRYAAAMVGKAAMALTFASLFGWALVIAWGLLLLKKISAEEKHLRKLFGIGYDVYARSTARIIPGIY
jgi:protein-S-isoprenylcysteine O-methyltransferase Ste14